MPHTPLLNDVARMVGSVGAAAPALGRRQFLRQTSLAAAAALGSPLLQAKRFTGPRPRLAIVGGGLAGLTCAYRLRQAGIVAPVYEANSRLGGRCWTRRGDFVEGQIAEHGGELIDQSHKQLRQLAQELRLPLDNVLAAEAKGTEATFYVDGGRYSYRDATADVKAIWKKLHRDLMLAGYPTLYYQSTPRGRELDRMSILDWLDESLPGGRHSRLGRLLDVAYNIEYGAECGEQSALNLIYLLAYNSPGQFTLFGSSNEKYHLRGGNDQVVTALAEALPGQIVSGTALIAVRRTAGGAYTLTFQSGHHTYDETVDKVVLALPFSILRHAVDLSQSGFSERKLLAIDELGMGSNSKLNVQFGWRYWASAAGLHNNGDTFSDTGYQATWEVSRAQPGTAGILVAYSGGHHADSFGTGTAAERALEFLGQVDPVLPGLGSAWNGRATVDYWRGDPFTRGSYSFWKVGQYTQFAGAEGERESDVHFCGEHTSIDYQGYLNGAVETGERVAAEIRADLRT
jgi:monoamine oxidase